MTRLYDRIVLAQPFRQPAHVTIINLNATSFSHEVPAVVVRDGARIKPLICPKNLIPLST